MIIFNISVAVTLIILLVKNPSKGEKKKEIFNQDVGLLETCLESVPTVFIMTIIYFTASGARGKNEKMNTILTWS